MNPRARRASDRIMRRSRLATLVALAVLASTASGCAFLRKLLSDVVTPPKLHFVKADVKNVSFTGLTLETTFRVENPNGFGLDLSSLGYALEIEHHPLAKGNMNRGLEVAASGSSNITLPFTVDFSDLSQAIGAIWSKPTVAYGVKGHFGFDTPAGPVSVPFEHKGDLPVPKLPHVRIAGAHVSGLGLTGANLQIQVAVDNPNAFPVAVDSLHYALTVSGKDVGSGNATPPKLPASGKASLTLPVHLSFTSAGRAIYDAIQSGRLDLGLSGSLKAGPVKLPLNLRRTVDLH